MKINCSVCGREMTIKEPEGEGYTTEADGTIHHPYDCTPQEPTGE